MTLLGLLGIFFAGVIAGAAGILIVMPRPRQIRRFWIELGGLAADYSRQTIELPVLSAEPTFENWRDMHVMQGRLEALGAVMDVAHRTLR